MYLNQHQESEPEQKSELLQKREITAATLKARIVELRNEDIANR